jgi:hypothetical protein
VSTVAPKPDWKAIKRDYVAGVRSLRDIGRQYGVSHVAIGKKAEKDGWTRKLADDIRERAKSKTAKLIAEEIKAEPVSKPKPKVTKAARKSRPAAEKVSTNDARGKSETKSTAQSEEAVTAPVTNAEPDLDEAEIVEANAEAHAQVQGLHRRDARNGRMMIGRLLAELDHTTSHTEEIEDEIWKETAGDRSTQRRAFMLKAISLPTRAGVMRDLATAMTKVVNVERQAYGMVDPDGSQPPGDRAPLGQRLKAFASETTIEQDGEGKVVSIRQRLAGMSR